MFFIFCLCCSFIKNLQAEVVLLSAERDKLTQELKRTPDLIQASLSELQQQRMYTNPSLTLNVTEWSKERSPNCVLFARYRRKRAEPPEGSSVTQQRGVGGIRIEANGDSETMWRAWGDHRGAPCWGPETTAAVWLRCVSVSECVSGATVISHKAFCIHSTNSIFLSFSLLIVY